jgi:hypothetical protein
MFLVMKQKEPKEYVYAEMNDHGDVREYATRQQAEQRAAELGGPLNGYTAESDTDARILYQRGESIGNPLA